MLRDKSQELPSSLTPQWLLNRGAAAAAGTDAAAAAGTKQASAAPSSSPAAGREGKWVADRWGGTEKESESKWGHDPYERPRWSEERPDGDERGLGGGRMPRDTGRWKPGGGDWGSGLPQSPFPPADRERAERWDRDRLERAELPPARDPVRDPAAARGRWRPDDKPGDKWIRGDTWRTLPGEGGAGFRPGGRGGGGAEDRYGDRPERGVGVPREEGGFATSRLVDDRLPGKGRGFGFGRGRPAGGPVAPGASSFLERTDRGDWGGRDLDGGLARQYSGHVSRGRKIKTYAIDHLEDLRDLMEIKVRTLPLPKGITPDELGEIWKGYVYAEHDFGPSRTSMDVAPEAAAAAAGTDLDATPPPAAAAAEAPAPVTPAAAVPPAEVPEPAAPAAQPPAAAEAAAAAAAAAGGAVAAVLPQPLLQSLLPPGMVVQALEHDQWLYKDPSGNQQGPFSRSDILDWAEQGFFNDTLPICSALPGQEAVWTTLHHMVTVWAQMARQHQPQDALTGSEQQTDFHMAQLGPDHSRMRVEAWLQQQPDQQQQAAAAAAVPDPHLAQQQQHHGQPHPGFPYGPPGGMPPHSMLHAVGGPGYPPMGMHAPPAIGDLFAAAAAATGGPGPASAGFPQQQLFPPPAQSFAPGGPVSGGAPAAAAAAGQHMAPPGPAGHMAPPMPHDFGPAAAPQQQQQQRTLFGTPLEPTPAAAAPAAAAAAAAGAPLSSTGSKMLDLLFKRGVHAVPAAAGQQQQVAAVEPPAAAAAAAAVPQDVQGSWETVPTKASKQQERAAAQQHRQQQQHEQEQQHWQQQQQQQQQSAPLEEDEAVVAPSGPIQVPLFPQQQQKVEPPKVAPWAAPATAAAAAAPSRPKSLREIQEEEQARAAEEAARAEAAAAAAAAAGSAAAAPGPAWASALPAGSSGAAPPGWGPPPMAAMGQPLGRAGSSNVVAEQPTGPVGADDLPAAVKKATLGDVLKARLGTAQRTGSNASSTSMNQAAAGPWGAAAQRQAVPLAHIMQQEHEETLADMEGGGVPDEGLDEIIAALSRHNSSNHHHQQQRLQQQQQRQQSGGNDDGLFWDYSGSSTAAAAAPQPPVQQQQQHTSVWAQPPAAVAAAQAAAAAARGSGAPSAAAPKPVAGPWARAAQHKVIKAPPPGSFNPAAAAAAAAARPAAAAAARPAAGAAARTAAPAASRPSAAAGNGPAAVAAGGSNGAAAGSSDGGMFMGGLDISAAFASWCRAQMLALNGNEDLTMVEFLMGLDSNSEIAEYCQMVWPNKPGVSSFVSEFVKRKLAEKNRKPGGKKKKGAAAAAVAAAPQPSGVSAAAVGLVHAGPATDSWSKIPKKAGGKKKKGTKLGPGDLGFTTANSLNVLAEDDDF